MANSDEEFLKKLRAAFLVEAAEHVQTMSSGLLELEKTPPGARHAELIEIVFREAHSLKGAARAVNVNDVENVCQVLENTFALWKRREAEPTPECFDTLHRSIDRVSAMLGGTATPEPVPPPVGQPAARQPRATGPATVPAVPASKPQEAPPVQEPAPGLMPQFTETVRIPVAKLDRLLLQAEELLAAKLAAAQRVTELHELADLLAGAKRQWNRISAGTEAPRSTGGPPRNGNGKDRVAELFDWNAGVCKTLHVKLTALERAAHADQRTVATLVDNLLEDTKKLTLLPSAILLEVLPKIIRDLSREQGKEVDFFTRGQEVEIDKRILEEMKDPLIHLLRNCVDHGLELPAERQRLGKSARGTVSVSITLGDNGKVVITVEDDGRGIDAERVVAAAVKNEIVTKEQAAGLSREDALALIFQSGLSTAPMITEVSGRGIGMAIVREKIEKLGGRVSIESQPGVMTRFVISLPVMLATFKGLLVEVSGQTFVIPSASVERVILVPKEQIHTLQHKETILVSGSTVALARLSDVLELPRMETPGHTIIALVLASGKTRIAFSVGALLHEQEVLVKPLGYPLLSVRNVAGATVLGTGKPVPVLRAADLVESAGSATFGLHGTAPRASEAAVKAKSVLLAEDSITSRMLLKNILESAGYTVRTAVDGQEAWQAVQEQAFDAVVSDVDMPRMSGFDLARKIRRDSQHNALPIILVTARDTKEDRERGLDAGASAYIVKGSFDQSNLLEVLKRFVQP